MVMGVECTVFIIISNMLDVSNRINHLKWEFPEARLYNSPVLRFFVVFRELIKI